MVTCSLRVVAAVAALAVTCSAAQAVVLLPGGAALTPGTNFGSVNGQVFSGPLSIVGLNALGDVKYTGNLHNNVYRLTNGHLLFAYWFFNDALSVDSVDRLSVTGFAGWGTNVDWASNAPPSGAAPVYADRSASGDTISFQFMPSLIGGNGLIEPGTNNFAVCIEVDAPNYALIGSTSTINGAVATVKTYAPVPEPTSLAILGIGIIGLAYRRNRR